MKEYTTDLIWAKIQIALTAIGGWLGFELSGGPDGLLIALVVVITLDYITGVMCAIVDHRLSSAIGFKGIFKKILIFMLVGLANVVDVHVVGTGSALRGATVCFYLSNEALSILENTVHLGLPVPEKLKEVLMQLHHRAEKEDTNTTDQGDGK